MTERLANLPVYIAIHPHGRDFRIYIYTGRAADFVALGKLGQRRVFEVQDLLASIEFGGGEGCRSGERNCVWWEVFSWDALVFL